MSNIYINTIVLFVLTILIIILSYGWYEFQYVMNFDDAEKIGVGVVDNYDWFSLILSNSIVALIIALLFIILTYPLGLLLKLSKMTLSKLMIYIFLVVLISVLVGGIIGSIEGYNERIKFTLTLLIINLHDPTYFKAINETKLKL